MQDTQRFLINAASENLLRYLELADKWKSHWILDELFGDRKEAKRSRKRYGICKMKAREAGQRIDRYLDSPAYSETLHKTLYAVVSTADSDQVIADSLDYQTAIEVARVENLDAVAFECYPIAEVVVA